MQIRSPDLHRVQVYASSFAQLMTKRFFHSLIPFFFQNAQHDTISSGSIHPVAAAPNKPFDLATNSFHGSYASFIFAIGSKFDPFKTQLIKRKGKEQVLTMFIQSGSLKMLAVPCIAQ
jgi:hypothetical protein